MSMNAAKFADFGQLYRAAFAEADPERKFLLLRAVQKVIDERQSELENGSSDETRFVQFDG
jgi:hypothetical protein